MPTLGQYLAFVRTDRSMTLREVESATDRKVSNAYLSQIENDKIHRPSPNILHCLAETYAISFENLMIKAGYVMPSNIRSEEQKHGRIATFAECNLTQDEETELLEYLKFIRNRKRVDEDE